MNKQKGDDYELYIRDHIINNLNKQAFLWSHMPETILIEAGIIGSHNENHKRLSCHDEDKKIRELGL